ncbi:MAG: bifunctional DNA primase/polymerase [Pseudonocardiaceae bacterium]
MDATCTTLRAWALHFARGWRVFPITADAKAPPVIDRWETRASTDPYQIHRWWQHIPRTIRIATGPSGLVVIDLDTRKHGQPVPHQWATLGIGWKIDTRAHGGYIVAPGCPVPPSGYELIDDRDPVELPCWLRRALTPTPSPAFSAPAVAAAANPSGYTSAAGRGEFHRVRTAPPGQHNAVLCRAAYALGQLIGAGFLDSDTARAELTTAASTLIGADCDCTPHEVAESSPPDSPPGARNPRRTTPRTSHQGAA